MIHFPCDNSYARLPERFFARVSPTPVAAPRLIAVNAPLAIDLGIDPEQLVSAEGVEVLAGNRIPEGAEPIATAYAGHQFGQFVPQLGDGRAILLGEVVDRGGVRRDVQLKGSGRTPFSRAGDGRAALGPVLREYLVSEAMFALGIPTTRTLGAVTTGETVRRETPLPGAVLTRVASSHIRVGTFQFFASRGDFDGVRVLADHVIDRHYPQVAEAESRYRALLDAVVAAQAALLAQWQMVGFIHGVMNTDNTSVAGETIDYGPCAFMDEYDPETVFSSIDMYGRYAYFRQPAIAGWNVARLAECLLPLLSDDEERALVSANEALEAYAPAFETAYQRGLARKLGLLTERADDRELGRDLLQAMAENRADWTLTFRRLSEATTRGAGDDAVRSLFDDPAAFDAWAARWRRRLDEEGGDPSARSAAMLAINPVYVPRNHRVEEVIRAAVDEGDLSHFGELQKVLAKPYEEQPPFARFAEPPADRDRAYRTFCGT